MSVWGDAIRALLRERGMSRLELARRAGVSRSTVLHVLRGGHCNTDTLERVARALEVNLAELFAAPPDLGLRRDRLVGAVLRELSESIAVAVRDDVEGRRRRELGRQRSDRRLPFEEGVKG
ncbi:MAG: helix-turn-helix domain-containing protein [Luteitalea sp.]|nr:helix-turn-helix domain-containing protein [Luteitalea sp.]